MNTQRYRSSVNECIYICVCIFMVSGVIYARIHYMLMRTRSTCIRLTVYEYPYTCTFMYNVLLTGGGDEKGNTASTTTLSPPRGPQ